jgi:hypothetical protein
MAADFAKLPEPLRWGGQSGECPLIGNCGHRVRFERDGSVANDPNLPLSRR